MGSPQVSIVICAYSLARWAQLVSAVESALVQDGHPEVIAVIDHNDQLFDRAYERWSGTEVRVLRNGFERGLSSARNTGISAAAGDVVAFLDDDAVARPDWLERLVREFDQPNVQAVGGSARPVWPLGSTGALYPPELYWIVGCSHRGLPETIAPVRNVIGSSMAFRRSALVTHGGFDLNTGRLGELPLGCEETDLCIRIRQADPDAQILLQPAAIVDHTVAAQRLTWRYLLSRSYHEGLSKAALSRRLGAEESLRTERGYVRSTLPRAVARELSQVGKGGVSRATAIFLSLVAASWGYARGSLLSRTNVRGMNEGNQSAIAALHESH